MFAKYLSKKRVLKERRIKRKLETKSAAILYALNMAENEANKNDQNYYKGKLVLLKGFFVFTDQTFLLNALYLKIAESVKKQKRNSKYAMLFLFFKKLLSGTKKHLPLFKRCWKSVEVKNDQILKKTIFRKKNEIKKFKKNISSLKLESERLEKIWSNIESGMHNLEEYRCGRIDVLNQTWIESLEALYLLLMIKKSMSKLNKTFVKSISWQKKLMQKIRNKNIMYWPSESIRALVEQCLNNHHSFEDCEILSVQIDSELFTRMWHAYLVGNCKENAQNKLALLMSMVEMRTLNGSRRQTQELVRHFRRLAPDAPFWNELAKTVQIAFPEGLALTSNQVLAKKINQFRYVISAQQMQFIRDNYLQPCMKDGAALGNYLNRLDKKEYSLKESARLHQKHKIKTGQAPKGYVETNIKVVVNFHSEFILNGNDVFVNEIDMLKEPNENENGIINGASFNYADSNDYRGRKSQKWNTKNSKHYKLDINIPEKLEPEFRTKAIKKYKAPSLTNYNLRNHPIYANNNQSAHHINKLAVLKFEKERVQQN